MDRRLLFIGFSVLFVIAAILTLAPLPPMVLAVGENSRLYGAGFLVLVLMVAAVLGTDLRDWF